MGSPRIDATIAELLDERGSFAVRELAERARRTRQALQPHLGRWLAAGRLERYGAGRSTRYRRPSSAGAGSGDDSGREVSIRLERSTAGLAEDELWRDLEARLDARGVRLTNRARAILAYAVTELVNNAIDHSGAPSVELRAERRAGRLALEVHDAGIGAFESIRRGLGLEDELHALQELSKGKVTTQPERHTGEGLFFTSKAVDAFELEANGLAWQVDNLRHDQAAREVARAAGTTVRLELDPRTDRRLEEVFDAYTTDHAFDRTRTVVHLFEHGTRFVSRSEAKRLAAGLERFREVLVDFTSVEGVGQGFADELFRVWARAHPGTRLVPVRMNRAVASFVERARTSSPGEP